MTFGDYLHARVCVFLHDAAERYSSRSNGRCEKLLDERLFCDKGRLESTVLGYGAPFKSLHTSPDHQ